MKTLGALVIFCATAQAGPTLSLVHTAAGSYGAQEAGKDAGPLYAFVRIDSAKAETVTLLDIVVEREGKPCSAMTKLERIATIPAIKQTRGLLRVDADKGTPFKGALAKGTTWLRIEAVMDHQCKVETIEPVVVVHFTHGSETLEVTRAMDEHLPS